MSTIIENSVILKVSIRSPLIFLDVIFKQFIFHIYSTLFKTMIQNIVYADNEFNQILKIIFMTSLLQRPVLQLVHNEILSFTRKLANAFGI